MTDKIDTTIHRATLAGYSSVVGQPIMLLNKAGACIGQLALIGAQGDYKAMTAEVARLISGDALRAEVDALRSALQASVAFADGVAEELGIEMSETIFTVRVMPKGAEVVARSWASVQDEARAALKGGDA